MSEQYTKVEIVTPKWTSEIWFSKIIQAVFGIAFTTLILWWFVATWFPEFGWTYWQLVLPVFTIRILFGTNSLKARQVK